MNSPASESRGERMVVERPAASPPAVRQRGPLSPGIGWRWMWKTLPAARRERKPQPQTSFALARPRRMMKSGRALLLWIPLWYAVAQLVMVACMNKHWRPLRVEVEQDKWRQLHKRLAESPDRPLILMLGSSRTDWAFQAGRLTGQPGPDGRPLLAYNLGVPTTGPLHEALYVNDLLDQGIRPRLLLLEFLPTHLNQPQRGVLSEEKFTLAPWLSAHQLRFFSRYFTNPRRAAAGWLEARLAPCYAFRWSLHEYLQGNPTRKRPLDQARRPMDAWGSRILTDDPGTPAYRAYRWSKAFEMYHDSLERFRLNAGVVQALHDLLDRCRREQIPVALVVLPVSKEFNTLYSPEGQTQVQNVLTELRERHGVEVIDASDWLDREDFDDGHHVLRTGAHKFTTRMIDEVQGILARSSATE